MEKYDIIIKKGGIKMKSLIYKFGTALACLALCITSLNVNTTCMLFVHQPKLPNNAKKLRIF